MSQELIDKIILSKLNSPQRDAVRYKDGPLLVFAGAGSGKTRVITNRIAYLIAQYSISPKNILGVTFTKKAAEEMKIRVADILDELSRSISGITNESPRVGTFHSIGSLILRVDGQKVGLDKNFSILDADDSKKMIKEVMIEQDIDFDKFKPKAISWAIQGAKNDLLSPERYAQLSADIFQDMVADVYKQYQKRLKDINATDFGDLLFLTVKLFKENEDVLKKYQDKYKYLLIDEYQDTNSVQYELAKMLAGKKQNLCVVGDDDQGIYKWRGADIKNIINFKDDFKKVKVVKLEQNYRSVANVIEAARSVITRNNDRVDKSLWTDNEQGDNLVLYQAMNPEDEANFVVDQIDSLKREYPSYKNFAVLYRTNAQSRAVEEAMLKRGVPYKLIGGFRFYDRREIKDVLSYLKFIHNPKDTVSLLRIINTPSRKFGPKSISKLNKAAKQVGCEAGELLIALYWLKNEDLPILGFDEEIVEKIDDEIINSAIFDKVVNVFGELFFRVQGLAVDQVVEEILFGTKYVESFNDDSDEAQSRIENLKELTNVATQYENLTDFLEGVALMEDNDDLDEKKNSVTLMTLHSSKGLEFPVVFMVGMEEGLLPHSRSLSEYEELEEERRLCYVGITRAKRKLFFTFAESRAKRGESWSSSPSRFLGEIPQEICEYYSWQ